MDLALNETLLAMDADDDDDDADDDDYDDDAEDDAADDEENAGRMLEDASQQRGHSWTLTPPLRGAALDRHLSPRL